MKYFDIHSHLHSDFFKENLIEVLMKMKIAEVGTILVGVNFQDSQRAVELAQKNENIWACIGQHPTEYQESFLSEKYQKLLDENKEKIVAVGECGLDYFWLNKDLKSGKISGADFAAQKKKVTENFKKQIDFAWKNNLPLMLHIRSFQNADAYQDAFKILAPYQSLHGKNFKVNFHFFTEKPEIAQEVIARGYYLSFPGVITFADLDKTIQEVPICKIMVETDAPFAAPIPYRGKTNIPVYVQEVVKKIAKIKNISELECREQLLKNTKKFFSI